MLARAQNFAECGPFCRYFASLGLAHVAISGDRALEEAEAKRFGTEVLPSIRDELQVLYDEAEVMSIPMRKLVRTVCQFSDEDELRMLSVDFDSDPTNLIEARRVVPFAIWDPKKFEAPRR